MTPPRPGYHLTAPTGNVNDPLGVTWWRGRYHLFFQWNPHAPQWVPQCYWGQVDAPDLVRWERPRVALAPDAADHGCWSGAAVLAGGAPAILYTAVTADALFHGRVALAHGGAGFGPWIKDPAGPVLDGPPAGLGVDHFRDPFVWPVGDGWRMVIGAGLAGGVAAALQYSSDDLRTWAFDGVLCSRPDSARDQEPTGTVWECPQLFELDGSWMLVVSVWSDGLTHHVSYAVGDYDGAVFTPAEWHRFAHGDSPYATTCFLDAQGRRCAISWCREPGTVTDRTWAGALTVPHLLGLTAGGRLTVRPHPDVDTLRTEVVGSGGAPVAVPEQADVVLTAVLRHPDDHLELALDGIGPLRLVVDRPQDRLHLRIPGRAARSMPLDGTPEGQVELRVLLDADVVEVFTAAGSAGAFRVPGRAGPARLAVTGSAGAAVQTLTVHAMERWFRD